jgi:hypothetical protein
VFSFPLTSDQLILLVRYSSRTKNAQNLRDRARNITVKLIKGFRTNALKKLENNCISCCICSPASELFRVSLRGFSRSLKWPKLKCLPELALVIEVRAARITQYVDEQKARWSKNWGSIPDRGMRVFLFFTASTGVHPVSYPKSTRGCFSGNETTGD